MTRYLTLLMLFVSLAGCRAQEAPLPTLIESVETYSTSVAKTENAPPPRFRERVVLPQIDQNLENLSGWHYVVYVNFEGVFSGTNRQTSATTELEVWYNELGVQRRTVLRAQGEIFGQEQPELLEGVRLGGDTYLVQGEAGEGATCAQTNDTPGAAIADLGAGRLIGGVREAVPVGVRGVINAEQVWRYAFLPEDLDLPNVQLAEGGRILSAPGELWFAAEREVVVRFYLTLDVENAIVFDSQLPVTGRVVMRYDVYDIGSAPNISIPFGC